MRRWWRRRGARERRLRLPATTAALRDLQRAVEELVGGLDDLHDAERVTYEATLAVQELAANIVEHAYGATAEEGTPGASAAMPTFEVRLEAALRRGAWCFSAETRDRGRPFDLAAALRATDDAAAADPEALSERGRGLALLRALTDELDYRPAPAGGENRWRIARRLATRPAREEG